MKKIKIHITFILLFFAAWGYAQDNVVEDTRLAIKSGSAKALVDYFDSSVDLKVSDKEVSYSKSQAEFVMKDFFKNNAPSNYVVNHIGSSPGGAKYCIGSYTSGDKHYRVYMKMKKVNGTYKVDTLHFTRE